ncbi:hypothetical protein FRC00_007780, partial [Tulasnella sp. 408]
MSEAVGFHDGGFSSDIVPQTQPGLFKSPLVRNPLGRLSRNSTPERLVGATDNSKSDLMEASHSPPSSTSSGSIFGAGSATLPTHFNVPDLASSTSALEEDVLEEENQDHTSSSSAVGVEDRSDQDGDEEEEDEDGDDNEDDQEQAEEAHDNFDHAA